jgi:hypothetical protein
LIQNLALFIFLPFSLHTYRQRHRCHLCFSILDPILDFFLHPFIFSPHIYSSRIHFCCQNAHQPTTPSFQWRSFQTRTSFRISRARSGRRSILPP